MSELTPAEQKLREIWEDTDWKNIATNTLDSAVQFIEKSIQEGKKNGRSYIKFAVPFEFLKKKSI